MSHRSISEQRQMHSPSVDEQETELEPSLEQDEEDKDQEQGQETEQELNQDGNVSPSRKKEIMVNKPCFINKTKQKKPNFHLKKFSVLTEVKTALILVSRNCSYCRNNEYLQHKFSIKQVYPAWHNCTVTEDLCFNNYFFHSLSPVIMHALPFHVIC